MSTKTQKTIRPKSDVDLWTDEALEQPYELWRQLRDAGPAVWVRRYEVWALPRYAEVREALFNWEVFSSAQGVGLNPEYNQALAGGTLSSDGDDHKKLRGIARRPLAPKALTEVVSVIRQEATDLIDRLVAAGTFDAVADLAQYLPLAIVRDLVGLPPEGRERMLEWSTAGFDCAGPPNERVQQALPHVKDAFDYTFDPALRERLKPGGWAARLWDAADAGDVTPLQCHALLNDYWGPSLDTTISATASAIRLFSEHPEQWDLVRDQPDLIRDAVSEVVRVESPIPQLTRVTTRDWEVDGITIPAGDRVMVMYGSANRDDRKWTNPELFDVMRKPVDQVGFGWGPHLCLGKDLARMEMEALLSALVERVERLECGTPEWMHTNMLRGLSRLPVTLHRG